MVQGLPLACATENHGNGRKPCGRITETDRNGPPGPCHHRATNSRYEAQMHAKNGTETKSQAQNAQTLNPVIPNRIPAPPVSNGGSRGRRGEYAPHTHRSEWGQAGLYRSYPTCPWGVHDDVLPIHSTPTMGIYCHWQSVGRWGWASGATPATPPESGSGPKATKYGPDRNFSGLGKWHGKSRTRFSACSTDKGQSLGYALWDVPLGRCTLGPNVPPTPPHPCIPGLLVAGAGLLERGGGFVGLPPSHTGRGP